MSGVAEMAQAAYAREQRRLANIRAVRERERIEQEAASDEECLAWVSEHPWIVRHLPDVTWRLIDRRFPQETAVISPDGEPDLCLIITRSHHDYVQLASATATGVPPRHWLLGASMIRNLEDIGAALADRRRRESAVEA